MTHPDERQLMRLLLGELETGDRRRLEDRLERDAELRQRFAALRSSWESLEDEPFAGVPPEFRGGVLAAARRLRDNELSWSAAPAWVRLGAAAALLLGVGLGVGVGHRGEPAPAVSDAIVSPVEIDVSTSEIAEPLSLAETFWLGFEEDGTDAGGKEAL